MGIFTSCQYGERGVKRFTYGKVESPHLGKAYSRRENDACRIHEKQIHMTKPACRFGRGGSYLLHVNPLVFFIPRTLRWWESGQTDMNHFIDRSPFSHCPLFRLSHLGPPRRYALTNRTMVFPMSFPSRPGHANFRPSTFPSSFTLKFPRPGFSPLASPMSRSVRSVFTTREVRGPRAPLLSDTGLSGA